MGRTPCGDRGRDWNEAAAKHRMSGTGGRLKPKGGKERSSPTEFRGSLAPAV